MPQRQRRLFAASVSWSEVELLRVTLLYSGLGVSDGVWPGGARQFQASESKIDSIRRISSGFHLEPASREVVTTTLEDVTLLEQHRDLIVRARPFDPPSGVSQAIRRGGKTEESLPSPDESPQ